MVIQAEGCCQRHGCERVQAVIHPFRQSGSFATVLGRGELGYSFKRLQGAYMKGMVSIWVVPESIKYCWLPLKPQLPA